MLEDETPAPAGWLTIAQLRERYNRSTDTIYRWVRLGEMPAPVKHAGRNYWRAADIRKFERETGLVAEEVTG